MKCFYWLWVGLQAIVVCMVVSACVILILRSFNHLPLSPEKRGQFVLEHLVSLKHALHHTDAAMRMQRFHPEGALFTFTLYGLAWVNAAELMPDNDSIRNCAIREAGWAYEQYRKDYVSGFFQQTQVPGGVLFLGQKNLLLGRLLSITPKEQRPLQQEQAFHNYSMLLAQAFLDSPTHHLETFPGYCWPGDNSAALVSLLLHDSLYGSHFNQAWVAWKAGTIDNHDTVTGLPAGQIDYNTGRLYQPTRGCANSWMLSLSANHDFVYTQKAYRKHKKHFLMSRLGFLMFREYQHGNYTSGDVDSGPIIRGAGIAATGIGIGAALANGDLDVAGDIHSLINMFGWPRVRYFNGEKGRDYLLGQLPLGDAFLAWEYGLPVPQKLLTEASGKGTLILRRFWFYLLIILIFGCTFYRGIRLSRVVCK